MRRLGRRALVALALALTSCSIAGHNVGIPATVQCPTKVPNIHPGKAKPRKFALADDFVRADICAYSTAQSTKPLALRKSAKETDRAWLHRLIRRLNALPVPESAAYSCPMSYGDFDLLRLYDGSRRVDVHVDLDGCGFAVGPNGMDGIDNGSVAVVLRSALA
jgi:hypothetical protein